MIFNSFQFIWLFPVIFFVYYGCSHLCKKNKGKISNILLLIISYLLYMQWNPAYTLILFGVTLCTYVSAIVIDNKKAYGRKKYLIATAVIFSILPLVIFKYYDFIISIFNSLFSILGISNKLPGLNWAIPVGLSFFTFQAVGYLCDVYYQKIKAERDFLDYSLFVSFFPQIMSGPISKAASLLPQIKAERVFDYSKAVQGLKWLLWGFFLKTVMADRLGLYVDTVYANYEYYSGATCLVASLFYSFQIYGDFAGYSLMAIGVGRLLGFDLVNNFQRPYFATSITEFWHRWHISLSIWLRDYIYIPLGGSRCSALRRYWNLTVTFLVSGIWHGANWTFVVWGVMHGILQIIEKCFRLYKVEGGICRRAFRIATTFLLVNITWIFFRSPSLGVAFDICTKIFSNFQGNIYTSTNTSFALMLFSIIFVVTKEFVEEYYEERIKVFDNSNKIIRWAGYLIIFSSILLFGVFDAGQFIYVSF